MDDKPVKRYGSKRPRPGSICIGLMIIVLVGAGFYGIKWSPQSTADGLLLAGKCFVLLCTFGIGLFLVVVGSLVRLECDDEKKSS
jgi:hypothetical protein